MKRIAKIGLAAASVAFFAQADVPTNAAKGFGGDEYSAVDPFWGCGGTQSPLTHRRFLCHTNYHNL